MTETNQIPEDVQNALDHWADEEQFVSSTFKMPKTHLEKLEENLPAITEFFETLQCGKVSRDTAIGHLIILGSNKTLEEMTFREAKSKIISTLHKLAPELEKELGELGIKIVSPGSESSPE